MTEDAPLFKEVFNYLKDSECAFVLGWRLNDALLALSKKSLRTGNVHTDNGPLFGDKDKYPYVSGRAFVCQDDGVLAILTHRSRTAKGEACNHSHISVFDLNAGKMFAAGYDFDHKKPQGDKRPQQIDLHFFAEETRPFFDAYPDYQPLCVPTKHSNVPTTLMYGGAIAAFMLVVGYFSCNRGDVQNTHKKAHPQESTQQQHTAPEPVVVFTHAAMPVDKASQPTLSLPPRKIDMLRIPS